jgi:tetratricopeptide (TPR) repeat protein
LGWVFAISIAAPTAVAWSHLRTIHPEPAEPRPVTFAQDVAPIVFAKCSSCHHPGEAAPFSLLTYDDVRRRARQIVEVTQKRFMPPWLPTEGHGDFANSRRLSDGELEILRRWVDGGAERVDDADQPAMPTFTNGWSAGPPDLVLETPSYQLSDRDRDVFRNFVIPIKLDSPRWVRSIEIRPLNPRVTHHARLGVDSSNESSRRDAKDGQPGYDGMAWGQDPDGQLVVWAPGMVADAGNPDVAWRLQPQTALVLHTHMQTSGKPEVVRFRVGIRFADGPPRQRPAMLRVGTCDIDIPAGEHHHTVSDRYVLPVDVDVHTIFPHAHSLCRELHVNAELPDGTTEPLISIDAFDENWHDCYHYRRPVRLPRGTRIVSTFDYDNSDDNVRNRHRPARRVVYGSNADDEMADVYLRVTAVHEDQRAALMEDYQRYELRSQSVGYSKTLELRPNDPWSREGLASCYVGLGEPSKAIPILEDRINSGPREVFPVVSLGMAKLAAGDLGGAETRLREAATLDGEYALAWLGLGRCLAAQNKTDSAEQAFRRAAELSPALWEARLAVADLLIRRGQMDAAANECRAAAVVAPEVASVYLKFAEISAKQKNWDESLRNCEIARRLAPYTHPPKVLVGMFAISEGDPVHGLQLIQDARHDEPLHPVPLLVLGQLARRQKQYQIARQFVAAAAALPVPDNWPESHRRRFFAQLKSENELIGSGAK